MSIADRWLLPDGIEEVLPPQAQALESLRRKLLDLYAVWGYELVFPPLIEFLESLLTGSGHDLDIETFKLTDQLTGRMMGVRADITPQAARIDAHRLNKEGPVRLCYVGSVLKARMEHLFASRNLIQVGVELFGHSGVASDIEVLRLMLNSIAVAGGRSVTLDVGHVGIYAGLVELAGLNKEQEAQLYDIYRRKGVTELEAFLESQVAEPAHRAMLRELEKLAGSAEILTTARQVLADAPEKVQDAINELDTITQRLQREFPDVQIYFDLSELRGYNFHTGVVFAAYVPGRREAIARGGRYDHIGEVFGRARPATGFNADLKDLFALYAAESTESHLIFAPAAADHIEALAAKVSELRNAGSRVVEALPGDSTTATELGCSHELVFADGAWLVKSLL
jgi:ATP phosphoribosyltransferase regulatory subunit